MTGSLTALGGPVDLSMLRVLRLEFLQSHALGQELLPQSSISGEQLSVMHCRGPNRIHRTTHRSCLSGSADGVPTGEG
jgi:hypothetical protein